MSHRAAKAYVLAGISAVSAVRLFLSLMLISMDKKVRSVTISSSSPNGQVSVDFWDPPITVTLKLTKTSTDNEVWYAVHDGNYSLEGAVYYVYRDAALTDLAGTITTDENGEGSLSNLPFGDYYVKEKTASAGFKLDTTVYPVTASKSTIDTNNVVTVDVSETPGTGKVTLYKSSSDETVTAGNSMYSLKGAKYGVYYDAGCSVLGGTITTDENGYGTTSGIYYGQVWVQEISSSPNYKLDETIYGPFTITKENASTDFGCVVAVEEEPETTTIIIHKGPFAMLESGTDFNADITSLIPSGSTATKIVFTDTEAPSGYTLVDVSYMQDKSVMAWRSSSGTIYVSTQVDGRTLYFNYDCSHMFDEGYYSPTKSYGSFYSDYGNRQKFTSITFGDNVDTSYVTNMSYMFYFCQYITSIDLSGFDTSNVTTMECMFNFMMGLTSLDLTSFNTSKVTTLKGFVSECYQMEEFTVGSGFDTSNVKTFYSAFSYLEALSDNSFRGISRNLEVTSKCTDLTLLFSQGQSTYMTLIGRTVTGGANMKQVFVANGTTGSEVAWDTSNVTSMSRMSENCQYLHSIYHLEEIDTSNVRNYSNMFYKCYNLTVTMVVRASSVTSCDGMFTSCWDLLHQGDHAAARL